MTYRMPCGGRLNSNFGPRKAPMPGASTFHNGVDFAAPSGIAVVAAAAGTVTTAATNSARGIYVVISHGGGMATLYQHLSSRTVGVGAKVKSGQWIGAVGSTGMSTGPHLHFEVHKNGKPVDPMPYLTAAKPKPTGKAPAFPLPRGYYYGPQSGPNASVSGWAKRKDGLTGAGLKVWQTRMKARGWKLDADGKYGPQTQRVARAFQVEKGLKVDGTVGAETWAAAWTTPIT